MVVHVCLFVGLVALALWGGDRARDALSMVGASGDKPLEDWRVWGAVAVYMALMAIPFCPGIEVGLMLLAMYGAQLAPVVYFATVLALLLAFSAGRLTPHALLAATFSTFGLVRAGELTTRVAALDPQQRDALLQQGTARWRRVLLKHRYAALGLALNLPGNIVLGDGGGIALAAGLSRLYTFRGFCLTVLIAVAPVPIAVVIFGV